jgi:branched-chain amino acid transport system substrate-binding protein
MIRHGRIATLLVVGTFIASSPAAGAAEFSGGVVRIGIINDQTGPLSDLSGPGSVTAAKMAAEDFQKMVPSIKPAAPRIRQPAQTDVM